MQMTTGLSISYNLSSNPDYICPRIPFGRPSYWVLLATTLYNGTIDKQRLNLTEKQKSYLTTIGFSYHILGQEQNVNRSTQCGKNYSVLAPLISEYQTESANSIINNCIRYNVGYVAKKPASASTLTEIVGELHDNVWSHAKSAGFSLFQKTHGINGEVFLEFAIADRGYGFFRELKRVNIDVANDKEAIDWCLRQGNTSKKPKEDDGWTQQLPADVIGNPMGEYANFHDGNHHQGLGLAKLKEMIIEARGTLKIASGKQLYILDNTTEMWDDITSTPWNGVAISFVIPIKNLEYLEKDRNMEAEDHHIIDELFI